METFLEYLIGPDEVEHAIAVLREAVTGTRPSPMAKTISELIVSPLVAYIEAEHRRTAGKGHQGTTTAMDLVIAAEDVAGRLADPAEALFIEHVNLLERKWREWLVQMGYSSHLRAKPFKDAPKKERSNALREVMIETWRKFENATGRRPTVKELWAALPVGKVIQEIDQEDELIFWTSGGKEYQTTFKSFQNRFTAIRKKIEKK